MSTVADKKLLVALDGSSRSIDTVKYLAQMPSFSRMQIHLFHIFAAVPDICWDLQREPAAISNASLLHAWESQHRGEIDQHMQKCKDILLAYDVHPKNIHIHIQKRNMGVARDIMSEARQGYAALVLRRRGMTKLRQLVLGSTALKLLNNLHDVPLIIAGRKPGNARVLIAFDGSENAMRAASFGAAMLMPGHHSLILACVLRIHSDEEGRVQAGGADKAPFQLPLDPLKERLEQVAAQLRQSGFSADSIESRIVSNVSSRAGTLLDIAEKEDVGTIIVGRKGHSTVEAFAMGRVSSKILQLGAAYTVWVVN